MLEKPGTDMQDEGIRRPEIYAQQEADGLPAPAMIQASNDAP